MSIQSFSCKIMSNPIQEASHMKFYLLITFKLEEVSSKFFQICKLDNQINKIQRGMLKSGQKLPFKRETIFFVRNVVPTLKFDKI